MTEIMIFNSMERFLWVLVIAIFISCGIYYLYKGYKKENSNEKIILFGYAGILISLAITRIFFFFSDFQVQGTYINGNFYGDYNIVNPFYDILIKAGYISAITGFSFFIFLLEINFKRTKYLITISNIIFLVLTFILPFDLSKNLVYFWSLIYGFIIFIILSMISVRSRTEFKAVTTYFFIGFIGIIAGQMFDSTFMRELELIPLILPPILFILGGLIATYPIIIKRRSFSKEVLYWLALSILLIYIIFFSIYTILNPELTNVAFVSKLNVEYTKYKIFLSIFPIIILAICSFIILSHNHNVIKDFKMHRQFNLAFGLFFIFSFLVSRIIFLLSELGYVINVNTATRLRLVCYGYLSAFLGISCLIYYIDKYFFKSHKFILSKLIIGNFIFLAIIYSFFPVLIQNRMLLYPSVAIPAIIISIMFIQILLVIKISDFYRFLLLVLGILCVELGTVLDSEILINVFNEYPFLLIISPSLIILGILLSTLNIDHSFKLFLEYYTTKQICLVHRGKIDGKMYFCPQCLVKYCNNCFNSVITVENKCWACNYEFTQVSVKEQQITLYSDSETTKKPLKHFDKKNNH
jgi:hypothetical protein